MAPRALSDDAKALLLLCGRFDSREEAAPFALQEFNRLEAWLDGQQFRPADLVDGPALARLRADSPPKLDSARVEELLARGAAMALAVEQWRNKGMWILCRGDESYPPRLRAHLGKQAPPILHGFGDPAQLDQGGLAVVGSRHVDECGSAWAEKSPGGRPEKALSSFPAPPAGSTRSPCAPRWKKEGRHGRAGRRAPADGTAGGRPGCTSLGPFGPDCLRSIPRPVSASATPWGGTS